MRPAASGVPAQSGMCPDQLVVFVLRAMAMFPSARRLGWYLGPELFQDPAARALAASLLTGRPLPPPSHLRPAAGLARLVSEVELCRVPSPQEPEYGLYLLRLLAEQEHLPILVDQLAWARGAVLDRVPLRFVRRRVAEAFAIAMGTRPLDARMIVGGRREWP